MAKDIYRCRVCGAFTEERVHCGVEGELLLSGKERVRLSKLMSGILRHFPEAVGLRLDREGFVAIPDLLDAIRRRWRRSDYGWVRVEHLLAVAALDSKGRFEVKKGFIRARYGHSVDVHPKYERVTIEADLYHGTGGELLWSIMREGLKPMRRRFVHLTVRLEDAWRRASSHRQPLVLVVDGRRLSGEIGLYRASDTVYLAKRVPPRLIKEVLRGR